MNSTHLWPVSAVLLLLSACGGDKGGADPTDSDTPATATATATATGTGGVPTSFPPSRIGVGSCSDPSLPLEILPKIAAAAPDLYIWAGDNVYADTEDMDVMRADYDRLAADPGYQALAAVSPFLATWDDHDYGANDAGSEYPMKAESKEVFLEFWNEPADSPRRDHAGIYHAELYQAEAHTLQVILLDTRTFRDPLTPNDGSGKHDYIPNDDPSLTLLGDAQWAWLEEQLQVPADLRLVVSSIQFGHSYNGWESWTNLPAERERMLELIRSTRADRVVMLSGDVHYGELSSLEVAPGYTLFDLTSSGINRLSFSAETNDNRIGEAVLNYHWGLVEVDWLGEQLTLSIQATGGGTPVSHTIGFDEISF